MEQEIDINQMIEDDAAADASAKKEGGDEADDKLNKSFAEDEKDAKK